MLREKHSASIEIRLRRVPTAIFEMTTASEGLECLYAIAPKSHHASFVQLYVVEKTKTQV